MLIRSVYFSLYHLFPIALSNFFFQSLFFQDTLITPTGMVFTLVAARREVELVVTYTGA